MSFVDGWQRRHHLNLAPSMHWRRQYTAIVAVVALDAAVAGVAVVAVVAVAVVAVAAVVATTTVPRP